MVHFVYLAWTVPKWVENKSNFNDRRKTFEEKFSTYITKNNITLSEVRFLDPNTWWIEIFPLEARFGRDVHMIYLSDAIIVEAQEKLWIWTAQEMLIAKYYRKPTIVIAPENSHHNKFITTPSNNHFHFIHPFLLNSADVIVPDQEAAIEVLTNHLSGNKSIVAKNIDMIAVAAAQKDFTSWPG